MLLCTCILVSSQVSITQASFNLRRRFQEMVMFLLVFVKIQDRFVSHMKCNLKL